MIESGNAVNHNAPLADSRRASRMQPEIPALDLLAERRVVNLSVIRVQGKPIRFRVAHSERFTETLPRAARFPVDDVIPARWDGPNLRCASG